MTSKKCKKCEVRKDVISFYKSGNGKRRGVCTDCYRDHRKISDSKPEARFKKYRRDAIRRGFDFLLTREEFFSFERKPCRYCGTEVYPISLDRIDNSQGYSIENIDACCHICNSFKHILDESEFIEHAIRICFHQSERKI